MAWTHHADVAGWRRRGNRAGLVLLMAVVVLGAMILVTAAGHVGVAAVLERASNCDAPEQCEQDYEHAFDETPLRTLGAILAAVAILVVVALAGWLLAAWRSRSRGGPAIDPDAGLRAAGFVVAAALAGVAVAVNASSLPHYEAGMDVSRAAIRNQMETAALAAAALVFPAIATVTVARAAGRAAPSTTAARVDRSAQR